MIKKEKNAIEIKTELNHEEFMQLDTEDSRKEFLNKLDEIMQARDELFENRLKKGLEGHKSLLNKTKEF